MKLVLEFTDVQSTLLCIVIGRIKILLGTGLCLNLRSSLAWPKLRSLSCITLEFLCRIKYSRLFLAQIN